MLYESETWTLKAEDVRHINSFEMWAYRRMLRTSRMEKRTYISILDMLKVKIRLAVIYKQRITRFFGHIMRFNGLSLKIEDDDRSHGRTCSCTDVLDRPDRNLHRIPPGGRH